MAFAIASLSVLWCIPCLNHLLNWTKENVRLGKTSRKAAAGESVYWRNLSLKGN